MYQNYMEGSLGGGGDFNVTSFTYEKKNHLNHLTRNMRDFAAFMSQCAHKDSPLTNPKFIWTSSQENLIICFLDHFLVYNC